MRPADTAELLKELAVDVREFVAKTIEPIGAKQAEIEARIALIPTEKAEPGAAGASAFDLACAAGFAGTETEWLDSLRGRDGESVQGEPGDDGKSITLEDIAPLVHEELTKQVAAIPRPQDGTSITVDDVRPMLRELVDAAAAAIPVPQDGEHGKSVTIDDVLPVIEKAVAALPKPKDGENVPIELVAALVGGEVAKQIGQLPPAKDGEDGRDATAIDPLPAIDPQRSYARGTWAKHQRGLWLARSATDGMHGWDCIVAGVASLEVISDGMRSFSVKSVLSDGQSETAEFALKTIDYRGAWAPGEYKAGDLVSWDGSMWHCEAPTTDRPGASPAWRLCVKHGRDGKDGLRGTRGERGTDGKPDRDYNGNRT
jgi:hypothetical protein